jgi:hypothetical protein
MAIRVLVSWIMETLAGWLFCVIWLTVYVIVDASSEARVTLEKARVDSETQHGHPGGDTECDGSFCHRSPLNAIRVIALAESVFQSGCNRVHTGIAIVVGGWAHVGLSHHAWPVRVVRAFSGSR